MTMNIKEEAIEQMRNDEKEQIYFTDRGIVLPYDNVGLILGFYFLCSVLQHNENVSLL